MWDTALLLSRFSFCIYIHRTARFTGSERKRGEAAQLTRILLPLILLEGFPAKADGGQSEAEQDLPPSASEIAFQPQSPVAPLEGRVMQSPRKGRLAPTAGRTRPLHPHKAAAADLGPPGSPDGAAARPGRGTGTPIPNPQRRSEPLGRAPPSRCWFFRSHFLTRPRRSRLPLRGSGSACGGAEVKAPGRSPRQGRAGAALGAAAPHACAIGTAPPAHPPLPLPPTTAAAQMAAV